MVTPQILADRYKLLSNGDLGRLADRFLLKNRLVNARKHLAISVASCKMDTGKTVTDLALGNRLATNLPD